MSYSSLTAFYLAMYQVCGSKCHILFQDIISCTGQFFYRIYGFRPVNFSLLPSGKAAAGQYQAGFPHRKPYLAVGYAPRMSFINGQPKHVFSNLR